MITSTLAMQNRWPVAEITLRKKDKTETPLRRIETYWNNCFDLFHLESGGGPGALH
jgi:hypothetical protein